MKLINTYWPFALALVTGLCFISFLVIGPDFAYFPGDLIDGRFNNYVLEHGYKFFAGQIDSFWNAPFMYPEHDVITYSDNLLGTAPFYALFRLMQYDRETSFQLWYLLMVVLNFTCSFILLDYLFKNKYAAAIGAFVFAFSLALQSQMGHAQTYPRFAIPIAILMGLRFLNKLQPKYFFWMMFCWVYQMYCGIYLGFMLLVPLVIFIAASFIYYRREYAMRLSQKRWFVSMAGGALINGLLLLPLMIPYLERARSMGFHAYSSIHESLPTVFSFFFSWSGSLCWDVLAGTCISYPAFWDHEIFAGGLATLCLLSTFAFFLFKAISKSFFPSLSATRPGILLFITSALTFLIFMRFGAFSFYRVIYMVPGFGSMRALQRIINVELLFYAIAIAVTLNLVLKKSKTISALLFVVFLSIALADNYVTDERFVHHRLKKDSQARIQALVQKAAVIPKTHILSYEPDTMTSMPMDYQLDAMLASQLLDLKTVNGYSGTSPGGYGDFWIKLNATSRLGWLQAKQVRTDNIWVLR